MKVERKRLSSAVTMLSAASSAPFLPTAYADLSSLRQGTDTGFDQSYPYAEIEITCGATSCNLSSTRLYGMVLDSLSISATTFTTTHGSDLVNSNAHGLVTGDGPIRLTNSGGALPAGSAVDTDYYVVANDANSFKLATTRANAFAGTVVNLTGDGTGTHTYTGYTSGSTTCQRAIFLSLGLLGDANDGAITLTQQRGYIQFFNHSPRIVAYALGATLSAGAITAKVRLATVRE